MTGRLKIALGLALTLPGLVPFGPAGAQRNSNEAVLVVFGNDPCPRDTICVRKPESEKYRIPEELRRIEPSAQSRSWAERARALEYAGDAGVSSCTPVGAGGWTGCYQKMLQQARDERRARATRPFDDR
jgi:hypothetical protein